MGLGQSEVDIDKAVDMLILIVPPGGGDGLQASKKGIMEAADLVLVNKADGDLLPSAQHTKSDYSGAIQFIKQKYRFWQSKVLLVSAATGYNMNIVENEIENFYDLMMNNHMIYKKRSQQRIFWMWGKLRRELIARMEHDVSVIELANKISDKISDGSVTPSTGANMLLQQFITSLSNLPKQS